MELVRENSHVSERIVLPEVRPALRLHANRPPLTP